MGDRRLVVEEVRGQPEVVTADPDEDEDHIPAMDVRVCVCVCVHA